MKYTVVLLRPEYLNETTGEEYGKDIYVAWKIEAKDKYDAVDIAQDEAYLSDKKDGLFPHKATDYRLCVLFKGNVEPDLFGWQ